MKLKNLLVAVIFCMTISLQAQEYKSAVGLRAAWGWALSGKHFIKNDAAVEAILTYRSYGHPSFKYNYFSVTGLYQIHKDIASVDGLQWYYGFGANAGAWGGDWADVDGGTGSFFFGVCGNLGLDYKFADAPINLSLDWIPTFRFVGWGDGFTGEVGGFAIRYTF